MTIVKAETAEELEALEAEVWVENLKYVATTYWGGKVKDVTIDDPYDQGKSLFDISELSNEQLNDRDRFPLFGYIGGNTLNTKSGYTLRWDTAHQSEIDSKFYMPKPVDERVLGIYNSVIANYPGVTEVEDDWKAFFPPEVAE